MTTSTLHRPATGLLPIYQRRDVQFVAGKGCELIAADGSRFLDFTSGIGVNALGYANDVIQRAMSAAARIGLVHTSNLFSTRPGERLASLLVARSFASHVFFCNSGAEACEGAIKFARRAAGPGCTEIVAHRHSFHGRTLGTLAVTDRPAYREPFEPVMPGVRFIDAGDAAAARQVIQSGRTAAVIVEPVQAEGGVHPIESAYLQALRERCDGVGAALIFDEVQCGLGRTGHGFAYEYAGVEPDILTLAKPLAGGLPMGAVLVNERIAQTLQPGDHASTFGGGPFVATVAEAVVSTITDPAFLAGVRERGEHLGERLDRLQRRSNTVVDVRGRGLMWGVEFSSPVAPLIDAAFEAHLLVLSAGPNVLRLLPPLVVSHDDIDRACDIVERHT